ncbi:MAG: COP23 domain-containing protein [Microcystaceae cyanobacterium]
MVKSSFSLFILSFLISFLGLTTKGQAQIHKKYNCVITQQTPRTVVDTRRGKIELIVWKSQFFGSQWSPERRCQEVTRRFQFFSDTGNLKYVTTGKINGYNVICVGDQRTKGYTCRRDGLLITLEPSDHPPSVMKELFDVNNRIGRGGVTRGDGSRPQKFVIDLDQFLQDASVADSTTPEIPSPDPIPPQPSAVPSPSLPGGIVVPEELQ